MEDDKQKERDRKGEQRKEEVLQGGEGSPMDETETDVTGREETTTTELVTHNEEAPEPEGDTPLKMNTGQHCAAELQERADTTAEEAEIHTETPDSPELD